MLLCLHNIFLGCNSMANRVPMTHAGVAIHNLRCFMDGRENECICPYPSNEEISKIALRHISLTYATTIQRKELIDVAQGLGYGASLTQDEQFFLNSLNNPETIGCLRAKVFIVFAQDLQRNPPMLMELDALFP